MAANTGITDGGDLLLYVEVAAVYTLIGEAKSHTVDDTSEIRTRRTKSSGMYPGRKYFGADTKVNTDCLVTYDGYGYWELLALKEAKTKVKIKSAGRVTAGKGVAEQIGDKYREGTFVIENISMNASEGEDAGFTASFLIDGDTSPNGFEIKTKAA
jgi:hypothetical protein